MKLRFLFLFLFIANFCVAQNQLQLITELHRHSKTYECIGYLNEKQDVKICVLDSSKKPIVISGKMKLIEDSFLVLANNMNIPYKSIIAIYVDKIQGARGLKLFGKILAYPEIAVIGFDITTALLYSNAEQQHQNQLQNNSNPNHNSSYFYNPYDGFFFVAIVATLLYTPIAAIGFTINKYANQKTIFCFDKKYADNISKLIIIKKK